MNMFIKFILTALIALVAANAYAEDPDYVVVFQNNSDHTVWVSFNRSSCYHDPVYPTTPTKLNPGGKIPILGSGYGLVYSKEGTSCYGEQASKIYWDVSDSRNVSNIYYSIELKRQYSSNGYWLNFVYQSPASSGTKHSVSSAVCSYADVSNITKDCLAGDDVFPDKSITTYKNKNTINIIITISNR